MTDDALKPDTLWLTAVVARGLAERGYAGVWVAGEW